MKIIYFIIISLILSACSSSEANKANTNQKTASPSPTVATEEQKKADKEKTEKSESAEKQKAINEFITKNYKGWKLEGVASEYLSNECEENSLCDLHLINGSQNKVVTVILRQFVKSDSETYWLIREARPIDLSKAKIEQIKESEREAVLENQTTDEVNEGLRDAIIDEWQEGQRERYYEDKL